MSFQYDQYLDRHRANVKRGFDWLSENLPGVVDTTITAGWNTEFAQERLYCRDPFRQDFRNDGYRN